MRDKNGKARAAVLRTLRKHSRELKEKYRVRQIGIFGSFVRGEQGKHSDLDILVELAPEGLTFENYMELKFYLEKLFCRKVDLATRAAIRPAYQDFILKEVIYA